jgi:Heparinase II/III-like protein/Heparinase II/III N-terminus
MRSSREIAFRLQQEVSNLRIWLRPPRLPVSASKSMAPNLPDAAPVAEKLRDTAYARQVVSLADEILAHRFRLLGLVLDLGEKIEWRRDAVHNKATGLSYFRRIPYLDFERAGDHKIIWELNRHQHLVLLAQAFLFTGREEYLREAERELTSWWDQNPLLHGINWCSALEVAFRSLSWIWLDHLAGRQLRVRGQLLESLYQHGCYLEPNLSIYFSPNTHLLGEAVALEAIGVLYPGFPAAQRWKETGARVTEQELDRQVRADGSHFEQSSSYQVYALDFFLLHRLISGAEPARDEKLRRMVEYLESLMGPSRQLPPLGDDDSGRVFGLPFGCSEAGQAALATAASLVGQDRAFHKDVLAEQAAWWLGSEILDHGETTDCKEQSRLYADSGIAVMQEAGIQIVIDGGRFGAGTAGHSHSDTLSLIIRAGKEEILIDPGTYTYVSDAERRNWFRGTAAHNTIRMNGRDQAIPVNAFRWAEPPEVKVLAWETTPDQDYFDGVCRYGGFEHRRRVVFLKQDLVMLVLDEIQGPPGEHLAEQFWHFALPPQKVVDRRYRIGRESRIWFSIAGGGQVEVAQGGEHGWRSHALGQKEPAPVLRIHDTCELPVRSAAGFGFGSSEAEAPELVLVPREDSICLRAGELRVRFLHHGGAAKIP